MSVGIKPLDEFAPSRTGGNPALGIADPVKPTTFNCDGRNRTLSGLVRLFSIHMDWRGLIRIGGDFDLLGIESPSTPFNPYGLG
jgi:hypothetical protein